MDQKVATIIVAGLLVVGFHWLMRGESAPPDEFQMVSYGGDTVVKGGARMTRAACIKLGNGFVVSRTIDHFDCLRPEEAAKITDSFGD